MACCSSAVDEVSASVSLISAAVFMPLRTILHQEKARGKFRADVAVRSMMRRQMLDMTKGDLSDVKNGI